MSRNLCTSASVLSVRSVQFTHLPPCCSVYFRVRFLFCTDSTDTTDIFVRTRIFTECHGIYALLHPCFSVVFRVVCSVRIPLIFRIYCPSTSVLSVQSVQFIHRHPCYPSDPYSSSIGIRVIRPIRTVHPSASVLSVRSVQTHSAPSV